MLEIAATAESSSSFTTTYSYKSIAFSSSMALLNRRISDFGSSVPLASSLVIRALAEGGRMKINTESGNASANWRAPWASMSMITCLPDDKTRSTSALSVP